MTIAITADLHFHPFPEFSRIVIEPKSGLPISSRLLDQLVVFREMCHKAKAHKVSTFIVDGDLFHQRDKIHVDVYNFVYAELKWAKVDMGLNIVLIAGNHDQMDDSGMIHSLFGMQDIATVVDTPQTLTLEGTTFSMVPFMNSRSDLMEALDSARGDILLAHCGVDGAAVGPIEYHIKDPITIDALHYTQHLWNILGHYHKAQPLASNTLYVGSPWQLDRAERGEIKRFLIFDPATQNLRTIRTGAKKFRTVTSSELILLPEGTRDDYYDVLLDGFAHPDEVDAAIGRLGLTSIKRIPCVKSTVSKARTNLSEDMTDAALLSAYISHKKADPNLLASGQSLLSAVSGTTTRSRLNLTRVVVENFMGIQKADLKLDRPGSVIAVLGLNGASGYQSNGAGKSTLLPESVFWCFFDQTARNLPADKVVNRRKKRNCRVTTYLDVDKHKLSVTRYRKHEKLGGNGLKLVLDGVPVTLGTTRLTEERLAKILGIDFVTFSSVVAFSPDTLRFVSSTDATQKHVLDSILQTRRFTVALSGAKLAEKDLRNHRDELSETMSTAEATANSMQSVLERYNTLNGEFEKRETQRVYDLGLELETSRSEAKKVETSIAEFDKRLVTVGASIMAAQAGLGDITELQVRITDNSRDLGVVQGELRTLRQGIDKVQSQLDAVNDQVGKPCPKCGQDIPHIGKLIANYQTERTELSKAEKLLVAKEVSVTEHSRILNQQLEEYELKVSEIESMKVSRESLRKSKATLSGILQAHMSSTTRIEAAIKSVPHNDYPVLIKETGEKITRANHEYADADQALCQVNSDIKESEFWIEAFGASGIRSFLLDQILPDLTEYANGFSSKLTGGAITIEFNTFTEGSARDRFQIQAKNDDGADIYAGNSSGEKRRVDVCVMLALFRIAHDRTKINVLLLDETLDSLDPAGLDNVVPLLEGLAKELGLTIFVTSHTELNTLLHESIVLMKQDGISILRA